MGDALDGHIDKICLVWVDDIVITGKTPEILLKRLLAILERQLESFCCSPQARFLPKGNQVCGKILSGQMVSHDPELSQGLSELRRPETAGELIQFLQAINRMRTSLPELAELEAPLRALLEECLCNIRRTKRLAARVLLAATSRRTNA